MLESILISVILFGILTITVILHYHFKRINYILENIVKHLKDITIYQPSNKQNIKPIKSENPSLNSEMQYNKASNITKDISLDKEKYEIGTNLSAKTVNKKEVNLNPNDIDKQNLNLTHKLKPGEKLLFIKDIKLEPGKEVIELDSKGNPIN